MLSGVNLIHTISTLTTFDTILCVQMPLAPPTQGEGNITRGTACATVTQPLGHTLVGPGDRHLLGTFPNDGSRFI